MAQTAPSPNNLENYLPDKSSSKIAVAMSGGVDSSVALYLLKKAGYDVFGITAWIVAGGGRCCDDGVIDAVKVCDQLGVEHHAVDLRKDFAEGIIKEFHESYAKGQTPIPCISCNNDVKWGSLLSYSLAKLGATHLASGHYAKLAKVNDEIKLVRPKEANKDQSYMLWGLTDEQLNKTVFPLADLDKDEIREIAKTAELCVADKPESQDICFVSNGMTNSEYLTRILGEKPGEILHIDTNEVMGKHTGSYNYTYGQRKGLGIAYKEPLYVVKIDSAANTVYVGTKDHIKGQQTFGRDVNWIEKNLPKKFTSLVKIRYNSDPTLAEVTLLDNNRVQVDFQEPVDAITPGQALAFYDPENFQEVYGGAWIEDPKEFLG
jgi:tRNA-uridine 2-sulfurtransferase